MTPIAAASKTDRNCRSLAASASCARLRSVNVDHHPLPVESPGGLVLDDGGLLAHPDHTPVGGEHAVLGAERRERLSCPRVRLDHAGAVVGMENVEPELVVGQPRIARVAQQLLDLGADVDGNRVARVVRLDDVQVGGDPGDVLDQPLEPALDVGGRGVCVPRSHS
jgi:hypothetical protein